MLQISDQIFSRLGGTESSLSHLNNEYEGPGVSTPPMGCHSTQPCSIAHTWDQTGESCLTSWNAYPLSCHRSQVSSVILNHNTSGRHGRQSLQTQEWYTDIYWQYILDINILVWRLLVSRLWKNVMILNEFSFRSLDTDVLTPW